MVVFFEDVSHEERQALPQSVVPHIGSHDPLIGCGPLVPLRVQGMDGSPHTGGLEHLCGDTLEEVPLGGDLCDQGSQLLVNLVGPPAVPLPLGPRLAGLVHMKRRILQTIYVVFGILWHWTVEPECRILMLTQSLGPEMASHDALAHTASYLPSMGLPKTHSIVASVHVSNSTWMCAMSVPGAATYSLQLAVSWAGV